MENSNKGKNTEESNINLNNENQKNEINNNEIEIELEGRNKEGTEIKKTKENETNEKELIETGKDKIIVLTNDNNEKNEKNKNLYYNVSILEQPKKNFELINIQPTFKIKTRTNNPNLPSVVIVERKFRDFQVLNLILTENNPGIFIPPLIEKYSFNKLNEDNVKNKQNSLERYLKKIVNHQVLKKSDVLEKFLGNEKFDEKEPENLNKKFKLFRNLPNNVFLKSRESDERFQNQKIKMELLSNQLKTLVKVLENLMKNRKEKIGIYDEITQSFTNIEKLKEKKPIAINIQLFNTVFQKMKQLEKKYIKQDIYDILILSEEYIHMIDSIKNCYNSRTKLYNIWKETLQDYEKKVDTMEKFKKSWRFSNDKLTTMKTEVDEINKKLGKLEEDFTTISETIQSEIQIFEKTRLDEFLEALQHWLEALLEKENEKTKICKNYFKGIEIQSKKEQNEAAITAVTKSKTSITTK